MAHNFLRTLSGYKNIRVLRPLYEAVVECMDVNYELDALVAPKIASKYQKSLPTVYSTGWIIHSVYRMYQRDPKVSAEVRRRARQGDASAKTVLDLFDDTRPWNDVLHAPRDENASARTRGYAHEAFGDVQEHRLAQAEETIRRQRVLIDELQELLRRLESHHEELLRRYNALQSHPRPVPSEEHRSERFQDRDFASVYALPRNMEYRIRFQRQFENLGTMVRKEAVVLLHKISRGENIAYVKLPCKRTWAPREARVSEVTPNSRLVWTIVRESCEVRYLVHYIGSHREVWPNSEA